MITVAWPPVFLRSARPNARDKVENVTSTRIRHLFRPLAWIMTVGGPFKFSHQGIKYEFQQIALIVGYEFRL